MSSPSPADAPPISRASFFAIMTVLMLVEVLSSLESSMVVTALPTVLKEFKNITSAGWLVSCFLLASAATAAVGGRLGDMFGRRRILIILVVLCGLGSLLSAQAPSLEWIIVGRTIQGASGAILPLCYGMTRELAPPGKAPLWIGLLTGGYSFSAAIGYILGGYLADTGTWRSVFYVTAAYSILLLPLLLLVIPATRMSKTGGKFDVLGAVMFAPAVAAMLYGITTASKEGWDAPEAWGPVVAGAVVLAIWVWHELRLADPLINLRLLRRREILVGNACAAMASVGVMQLPLVTLLLLQQPRMAGVGLAVSATVAGFLKLPSNVGALAASPLGGWISGKYGARWAMLQGGLICVVGWVSLYLLHDTLIQVVAGSVVCAFGSSVLLSAIPNLVLEGAPMERSSEVTGLTSVIRSVFAGIGAQVIAILLATSRINDPKSGANYPAESAYQLTFLCIAVSAALVAVLCLGVPPRRSAWPTKAEPHAGVAPARGATP